MPTWQILEHSTHSMVIIWLLQPQCKNISNLLGNKLLTRFKVTDSPSKKTVLSAIASYSLMLHLVFQMASTATPMVMCTPVWMMVCKSGIPLAHCWARFSLVQLPQTSTLQVKVVWWFVLRHNFIMQLWQLKVLSLPVKCHRCDVLMTTTMIETAYAYMLDILRSLEFISYCGKEFNM